jgi:regulator of sigma E protease
MSIKQVGGPLTIGDVAGKAASAGPYSFFNFIAIISINLAILNLLPIPVLDGGHLVFLSVEAVRRKPLSEKVMKAANAIGLSLLLVLIVFVIYNDIMRIVVPWIQGML